MRRLPIILFSLLAACSADVVAPRSTTIADKLSSGNLSGDLSILKNSGELVVWGDNSAQQISDAPVNDAISQIATGGARQGLVIRDDGSLVLWGSVGVTGAIPPLPASLAADRYRSAYLSLSYLQAVRLNHSVMTWGAFFDGRPATPPAGLRAVQVAGGSQHGVALEVSGRLVTWGTGPAAIPAPAGKFSAVGGRTSYSIALRRDGTLFGWGTVPLAPDAFNAWVSDGAGHFYVANEQFVSLAAGNNHIIALRADGSVAGWGTNGFGQITAPTNVHFTEIAAGLGYSIGLDAQGLIHHWGDASNGTGLVPPGQFATIAAGARHASALRALAPHK
ncbi:MAG: hypothetical protein Q8K82_26415 [Gemmatimonadaceae bacterium]|nr:hypothetical protein [Gemmatimonadaceae bacterium]